MSCSAPAKFIMFKIGFLQNCFEDIFDEYTLQFVNKMHWIQLQYRVEKKHENLSFVRIFWKNQAVKISPGGSSGGGGGKGGKGGKEG